jgi:hypothetical protein
MNKMTRKFYLAEEIATPAPILQTKDAKKPNKANANPKNKSKVIVIPKNQKKKKTLKTQ